MSTTAATDFKQRVLDASDIVEVIGRSVALKRRGKDYVGLCPFHQEKSPSFSVNPAKQLALELAGSVPMAWGAGTTGGVASYRLTCQLAENAKYPCVVGVLRTQLSR